MTRHRAQRYNVTRERDGDGRMAAVQVGPPVEARGTRAWPLPCISAEVPRSLAIPQGIEEWWFRFGFYSVFWLDCLEDRFVEARRA